MEISSLIRYADVADALDIASVNVASWQHAYRGIIPDIVVDNISVARWADGWKAYLEDGGKLLVYQEGGKILGFVKFSEAQLNDLSGGKWGEVNAIYLLPQAFRRGIGACLCYAALAELEKMGLTKVMLWVLVKNQSARYFYQAIGFKPGIQRICPLFPHLSLEEVQYTAELPRS